MDKKYSLSKKQWISLASFASLGSLAWCIENQFLNLFIDRTITTNPFGITLIVAASAITATVTTLLVGVKLDRHGKRIPYIKYGYMIWGISIMAFCLITVDNFMGLGLDRNKAIAAAVIAVAIMDCVMTFFGSTANDAAFNAWITDNTTEFNRSKTEGALGVFAAIGTALVFGLDFIGKITYNTYYDAEGNQVSNYVEGGSVVTGNWTLFFLLLGGLVLLIGIVGKYFLEENPAVKPNPESSYKSVLYGFKLSVIKENKFFYICLAATSLIGIANMVSGPYSLIYIERSLGFKDYIIPFAVIGFLTVVFAFIFGSIIDKKGRKSRFLFPGLIIALIGNIIMFFSTINNFGGAAIGVFCVGSTLGGVGGAIMGNVLSSKIRDFTPSGRVGLFQGVRMTFNIMIPMVLGPLITALITTMNADNIIGLDEYGNNIYNYSSDMFIVTCLIMLFVIIPFIYLMKTEKKSLL